MAEETTLVLGTMTFGWASSSKTVGDADTLRHTLPQLGVARWVVALRSAPPQGYHPWVPSRSLHAIG